MALNTRITGKFSKGKDITGELAEASLHVHNGKPVGQLVYSTNFDLYDSTVLPFLDIDGNNEMAIDGSFGGTPELVHNGTDSIEWTGSAISGTWDFASTAQAQAGTKSVDATATVNNDEALFSDATTTDFSSYVGLSGYVYLTKYSDARNDIELRFRFSGGDIGNSITLNSFIDTGLLNTWQKFSISKDQLGIDAEIVNELVCRTAVSSGSPPEYYLDTIQIEETGSKEFTAAPPTFKKFLLTRVNFQFTDNIPLTVTDGTAVGLSYNKIMGLNQLIAGINFIRFRKSEIAFSANVRDFSDLLLAGGRIDSAISDGVNSSVVVQAIFDTPVVFDKKFEDKALITFSEDLSGLVSFKAVLIGKTERDDD